MEFQEPFFKKVLGVSLGRASQSLTHSEIPHGGDGGKMNEAEEKIVRQLFELQDMRYREFNSKLIPDIQYSNVIGVRTPELRRYAKELAGTEEAEVFMHSLPHKYFEENNLHGFLIEKIRDYDRAIDELDAFLPYIDNWATCDQISPAIFKRHLPELYGKILVWIKSEHAFTVRFAIGMLMKFYLDENFDPAMPLLVANTGREEYYIKMMVAWYFATALAKQYDAVIPYIADRRLDVWTHNKTIQKAVESLRISPQTKEYLRTLKIRTR